MHSSEAGTFPRNMKRTALGDEEALRNPPISHVSLCLDQAGLCFPQRQLSHTLQPGSSP